MPYIHQSESWGRSIFPPAPVINGVQCLPLCIGHIALLGLTDVLQRLSQVESAGGAVVEGLTICSQSFEDSVRKINKGPESWQEDLNHVGERVVSGDVDEAIKCFAQYIEDSQEPPVYFQKQTSGNSKQGSDFWFVIKTLLQERLHLSDYEMMNRPVSQCLAEYFTIAEREGWITLKSQDDAEFTSSDQFKKDQEMALKIAKKLRTANG